MKLTGISYCDFAVWSPNELVVLNNDPANDIVIAQALEKETTFFKFRILPELVYLGTLKHLCSVDVF